MERYYEFAGVEIAVSSTKGIIHDNDRSLTAFRVERPTDSENLHRFHFEIAEEFDSPTGELITIFPNYRVYQKGEERVRYIGAVGQSWKEAYIKANHQGKEHLIQLKSSEYRQGFGSKTILNSIEAEHLVVEAGGVIFHASYIEWNGKGILFTAPSETGKSTQADLWRQYRQADIINGDRAVIRIIDGEIYVSGVPFSGSSVYCKNVTVPLVAVVYLQQAPVTTVKKISGAEAFSKVWEGCTVNTWDKEDVVRAVDIVQKIISTVPIYFLACTPDESAVLALESELSKLPQPTPKEHNFTNPINLDHTTQPTERK